MELYLPTGGMIGINLIDLLTENPFRYGVPVIVESEGFPVAMRIPKAKDYSLIHDPVSGVGYIINLQDKTVNVSATAHIMRSFEEKNQDILRLKTDMDIEEILEKLREMEFEVEK